MNDMILIPRYDTPIRISGCGKAAVEYRYEIRVQIEYLLKTISGYTVIRVIIVHRPFQVHKCAVQKSPMIPTTTHHQPGSRGRKLNCILS